MATEYAHQPVVFLEYYPHTGPAPTRQTRYTAAAGYGAAHPWAMVSSGFKWAAGAGDYATIYRGMINADLPRPAQLDLRAWYRRDGNTLRLYARVHNTSGLTLHSPDNDSRLWGLALEENSTAAYSGRKALRAEFDGIAFLDPGGVSTHALNLSIPTGANWNNVRSVVMVEYRPGGGSGPYDVLHAVRPRPADFTLSQDSLHFNLPEGSNTAEIRFDGPPVLEWTALAHVPWLQVAPWAGTMEQPAQVQVLPGHLPSGDHEGEITFAATSPDGMFFEVVLPVSVTMDQEAPVQHFPGVAGLPGQGGTRWRSSLTLANPFPSEREVLVELQARGTGVTVASHTFTPAAGELIFISDVYQHFDAPSGAGALRLTGDAYAWVRTFNQADEGTFGQDVVGTGEGLWQDGQGVLFPINQPADPNVDFRSNLLLLNLEDHDITAHVTAGDRSFTVPLPAGTYVQVNGVGGELGLPTGPALVRVEADGAWTGSVSTVDGVTGDPTTVRGLLEPAEDSGTHAPSAHVQHFPGVAGLPGQGGTRWRSSLTLANPFPSEREVLVELQARGTGVTVASHTFTPAAGELIFISDIYQHFDAPSGAGSLRLTGDAYAWVRTFNQADEGTFGQDVVGTGEGLWQDGQGVLFPINQPADPNVDFRSNLLLLNLEDRDITAHVTAGDSAVTVPVPAGTYVQVNGLGGELGLPAGPALVRVEADGAWTGSVSTVDGVTGDPTTVRGLLEPAEE